MRIEEFFLERNQSLYENTVRYGQTNRDPALGDGELQFNPPTWEQMPTQNHIVEAFCNLDILEYQPAYVMAFEDNNDLRGQRRLK